jgi:eukaryotic-like serine/threonine-protein kinase
MPLEPGRSIGHYRIVRQIGRGAMGAVFLAEDTKLERNVALKVLPEEMASDPDRLTRFRREAKAIAALNHPNIVTLYSVEELDGIHFLTMELVEGESLDHRLASADLPLAQIFGIGIALADALEKDPRWLPFLRKIGKTPEQLAASKFNVKIPGR